MALSKLLFPTWITVIPNIFCNVSSHILIYKCMTMHMPYLIQTVCDGCVQCVYLEHSPICHSLSLSPLCLARSRQRLARLVAVTISADSCLSTTGTRHPVIRPRHLHPTSTGILHLHTGTLNKWYSSIQIWYYCLYSVKMYQQVWFVCTKTVHIIYIYYLK